MLIFIKIQKYIFVSILIVYFNMKMHEKKSNLFSSLFKYLLVDLLIIKTATMPII